jgi:hypothetical protein
MIAKDCLRTKESLATPEFGGFSVDGFDDKRAPADDKAHVFSQASSAGLPHENSQTS